jgi:hypothetical protein
MRIAILISGRIARYECCLLPILNNSDYHIIDLFVSVNDKNTDCEYYNIMKINLQKWLKFISIKEFIMDKEIYDIFDSDSQCSNLQKINNKFVPYNALSMYYNDMVTFNEACKYADKNGFEYDIYLKFRSDIIANNIPKNIIKPSANTIHLYSHTPLCNFISVGIYKKPIVCDIYAWGNRQTMSIYCNTYNYVINKIKLTNGTYFVCGECCLTDNIYENNVEHSFHYYGYELDKYRRMFDNLVDSRVVNIKKYDISTFNVVIPSQPQ